MYPVFKATVALGLGFTSTLAHAATDKPNILVIMSDDVGITNISAYSRGLAGYQTPNIDRIATEGMIFTDYYAEQSCTAGRSAFITGQHHVRTGLTKVGFPGSAIGIQKEDPTLAELLKNHGYATGQFGKITSATVTSTCRQFTGLMSSTVTFIT
jgi:arylsulfatase